MGKASFAGWLRVFGVPTNWCELGRARESAFGWCHRQIWFSPSNFCGCFPRLTVSCHSSICFKHVFCISCYGNLHFDKAVVDLGLWVLIDMDWGSKHFDGCDLPVWLLRIMSLLVACRLVFFPWVFMERFGWKCLIFMVFEWVSVLDCWAFMYPRCVDRAAVLFVELWSFRVLILSFGGRDSSDKCGMMQKWRVPDGGL